MKKYELTEEHRAQLKPWADQWIRNAMSAKPMDEEERQICREAVKGMYLAANLEPPPDQRIVFVSSPFMLRFAGGFAAAIWYLRKIGKDRWSDAATRAATRAATDDATDDATYDATDAVTHAATYAATHAATYAATRAATHNATHNATHAATHAATYAATDDATYAATRAATYAATYDATRAATYAATLAVDQAKRWYRWPNQSMVKLSIALNLGKFGIDCAYSAYRFWRGGNQWSGWASFISFFRYVAKLPIDYSKWDHYEQLARHAGPYLIHEKFCMISDRPKVLKVDEQNRPHCDTGPFCEWRDGAALYSLHGVRVPQWLVETPVAQLDPASIMQLENAEQRKEGIKKIGIDRMRDALKVEVLHTFGNYELWSIEFEGRRIGPYLRMVNDSTGEIHVEGCGEATGGVDPKIKTCQDALVWRGGFTKYNDPTWKA